MILSSVSYRRTKSEPEKTWRFASPQGNGRQIAAIYDSDEGQLRDLSRAVDSLAAPATSPTFFVAMTLVDDDGNTWTIERGPGRAVLLKNSVSVSVPNGSPLLTLISDVGGTLSRFQPIQILARGNEITARGVVQATGAIGIPEQLQERIHSLCHRAATVVEQTNLRNPEILLALAERTGLLWSQIRECQTLIDRITAGQSLPPPDQVSLKRLGEQIVLLDQVERTAGPIIASREAGRVLKETLERVELELRDILHANRMTEDQAASLRNIPWSELIAKAAEVERLENLVRYGEECQQLATNQIRPIVEEQLKKLEDQFQGQGNLSVELSQYVDVALSDEQSRESPLRRALARGRAMMRKKSEQGSSPNLPAPIFHLTRAQAAAQEAMACINEVQPKLASIRDRFEKGVERSYEAQEGLVKELGRTRKALRRAIELAGLPTSADLSLISGLAQAQSTIVRLLAERDELIQKIHQRREQLIKLQRVVLQWRQLSGSQKQSDLQSASILLNEARSLVQLKEEKIRQFQKLAEAKEAQVGRNVGVVQISSRLAELQQQWELAFGELGLIPIDGNDGRWRDLLRMAQEVKALTAVLSTHGMEEEQSLESLLSQKGLLQLGILPVLMLRPHTSIANTNRISDLMCSASRNLGLVLILTSDQAMTSKVASEGAAIAHLIQTRSGAAPMHGKEIQSPTLTASNSGSTFRESLNKSTMTPAGNISTLSSHNASSATISSRSSGAVKSESSLLSSRARAALDILNGPKNKTR